MNRLLVLVELVISDGVEWILSIRSLVDGSVVLISTLDYSLGGCAHQHHMIASFGDIGVLEAVCLIPGDAFQDL